MEGHSECFSERAEVVGDEFRTSVGGNMGWDSVLGEHVCNKELGELRGSDGVVSRNEYSLLQQVVHDDEDGGKSIGGGELLDEVHGDRVPWVSGDWELFK